MSTYKEPDARSGHWVLCTSCLSWNSTVLHFTCNEHEKMLLSLLGFLSIFANSSIMLSPTQSRWSNSTSTVYVVVSYIHTIFSPFIGLSLEPRTESGCKCQKALTPTGCLSFRHAFVTPAGCEIPSPAVLALVRVGSLSIFVARRHSIACRSLKHESRSSTFILLIIFLGRSVPSRENRTLVTYYRSNIY